MAKSSITSAASNSVTKREKKTRATSSEPPQIAACKALRENCQTAGLLIIFSRYFPVWIQPPEIFTSVSTSFFIRPGSTLRGKRIIKLPNGSMM